MNSENLFPRRIRFFAALLVFLGLGMCFLSCGKAQASSGAYLPRVKLVLAENRRLEEEVSGFGSLSFLTKVDIAVSQEGLIRRLYYREGDTVPLGARVAVLENPQIELAVGRAENALSQARAALKLARSRLLEGEFNAEAEILSVVRTQVELTLAKKNLDEQRRKQADQEILHAAGGLSDEAIRDGRFGLAGAEEQFRLMERDLEIRTVGLRDRDLAAAGLFPPEGFASEADRRTALIRLSVSTLRAEAEAAEAQLEAARKELESVRIAQRELVVYSPAAGTVGARYLEEGERAKKEDKILTLIDTGSLYVIFSLREQDALRIRRGMSAGVSIDGAEFSCEGTVDLVAPQADSQSFTFTVRVLIPPEALAGGEEKLKPGMFARVKVKLGGEREAVLIPEGALVNRKNDGGTVFVVSQGMASERQVRFGAAAGEDREILSGLRAGEAAILRPDVSIKEGTRVVPEE
ncbi:MAG: efflux RND transporter periplasmic adaptor subunit [Treponema sp.]|jgi:RND family efflux transporter MFP subunit|nr:efflux RND transporter periplasmic adaptor subunit [Treponema sp.]